jgi:hypothetical protein
MDRKRTAFSKIWIVAALAMVLAVTVLLARGCRPGARTASEVVLAFMDAVQREDMESLYCLSAGASEAPELGDSEEERRANFEIWAWSLFDSYLAGRDEGWVRLEGHGIVAVKLLSLGKGTYFRFGKIRTLDSESLTVETARRLGYTGLDLSGLSPGATFYLCGVPLGKVHAIRVPERALEIDAEVLESITLRWTITRRPAVGACPEGWAVASVTPLEESVSSEEINWSYR